MEKQIKYKVKFINVGRDDKCWEAETATVDHDWLYAQVKKNMAILSSGVEFYENGSIVVGGFRIVGKFEVMEIQEQEGGAA